MLALALTFVLAVFVIGPDFFSRWVVGLFAPPRLQTRSKSEEIGRALLNGVVPLAISLLLSRLLLRFHFAGNARKLWDFICDLNSGVTDPAIRNGLFAALPFIIHLTIATAAFLYSLVLAYSLFIGWVIATYGARLDRNTKNPRVLSFWDWLVRPWIPDWYMQLTPKMLTERVEHVQVDILIKLDILFRGRMTSHLLKDDGSLVSVTLEDARKFLRTEFIEERKKDPTVSPNNYWRKVKGNSFTIMASEIVTLNTSYVEQEAKVDKLKKTSAQAAAEVLLIANAMSKAVLETKARAAESHGGR